MKFGVVVFPGSNCDRDMQDALSHDLGYPVEMLWHKDSDLSHFTTEDCVVLPGGFSYGDYLRCGAIAKFSPTAILATVLLPEPLFPISEKISPRLISIFTFDSLK